MVTPKSTNSRIVDKTQFSTEYATSGQIPKLYLQTKWYSLRCEKAVKNWWKKRSEPTSSEPNATMTSPLTAESTNFLRSPVKRWPAPGPVDRPPTLTCMPHARNGRIKRCTPFSRPRLSVPCLRFTRNQKAVETLNEFQTTEHTAKYISPAYASFWYICLSVTQLTLSFVHSLKRLIETSYFTRKLGYSLHWWMAK